MTFYEKITLLKIGSPKAQEYQFGEFSKMHVSEEDFSELVQLLEHEESFYRFWSLDLIIKNASAKIIEKSKILLPKLLRRVFDKDIPVADRAFWAIDIIGQSAVNYILDNYQLLENEEKEIILRLIPSHKFAKTEAPRIIELLVEELKHLDKNIRFSALIGLVYSSPLKISGNSRNLSEDFSKFYKEMLQVSLELKLEEEKYLKEMGIKFEQAIRDELIE